MRIVQSVFGVFHHFELARELNRRGHLQTIYSTWPWARLKREGLPHPLVQTFPWIHTPEAVLHRLGVQSHRLYDQLGYANALAFDTWTNRRLERLNPAPDALIAISGSSLLAGRNLQRRGGLFICDRGSSHQRYQEALVSEEFARWGVTTPVSDLRDTIREEAIYEAADAITVPSHFAARSFIEMGVPAEKVHVIPYGVRLENFTPTTPAPAISERFEVLFAGQVSLRKGVPYLLEAFAKLRHPNKRLRIIGAVQPDLAPILQRLSQANVEFLGVLPQPELARLMSSSHVLVLPSIEEGLALVQGQAMACGCPVIATTNTGAEDLFTNEVEGYIVPIRDPAAITARLQQLADDPNLHSQLRAACLQRVHHLGGWHHYGNLWEQLLTNLTHR